MVPLALLNLVVVATYAVYGWGPAIPLIPISLVFAYWYYRRAWNRLVAPRRPRPSGSAGAAAAAL